MRVAVVGSGLSGLAAARKLSQAGYKLTVFEKSSKIGGRVETLDLGGFVFDPGATTFSPMGHELESVMTQELDSSDLVRISSPVMSHDGVRLVSGHLTAGKVQRYCYRFGNGELPKLLSEGLDVRLSNEIRNVEATGQSYKIGDEEFDFVIVSAAVPIAQSILSGAGDSRRLTNTKYRSCVSLCLGYDFEFSPPYHALIGPDQIHPISWISFETTKVEGTRAPKGHTGLVVQMSAEYSKRRWTSTPELILEETLGSLGRLLGERFEKPILTHIVKYEHSHPETTTWFQTVNSPMSRLFVIGDGLMGGRTELAFDTGLLAAKMITENS